MTELVASTFRLSIVDIANGDGVATVTLRSGVQFTGKVERHMSEHEVVHLRTLGGWHTIDYDEIAAVSGEVDRRGR